MRVPVGTNHYEKTDMTIRVEVVKEKVKVQQQWIAGNIVNQKGKIGKIIFTVFSVLAQLCV